MTDDGDDFFTFTVDHWMEAADSANQLEKAPSKHCRICQEPSIMNLVNKMLTLGYTGPDVVSALQSNNAKRKKDGRAPITHNCVKNHRARHFDDQVPSAVVMRRLQEANAQKMRAENIDDMVGTLIDARTYHQTMMLKGYEALMDPHQVVSPELGGKSATWLYEQDRKEEEGRDMAHMQAQYSRMIETIRHFIDPDKWPEVVAMLRGEQPKLTKPAVAERALITVDIDDTPEEA